MQRGHCSSYGSGIQAVPLCFMLCEDFPGRGQRCLTSGLQGAIPFGVISDYLDIDVATQVQLFCPEHRHGGWLSMNVGINCGL